MLHENESLFFPNHVKMTTGDLAGDIYSIKKFTPPNPSLPIKIRKSDKFLCSKRYKR